MIPAALVRVILSLKIMTARIMERTCFTLPATVMVKALVFLLAVKETTFKKKAMIPFATRAKNKLHEKLVLTKA